MELTPLKPDPIVQPLLNRLNAIVAEAKDDYTWGGSEDADGGLMPGRPDWDRMITQLEAFMGEVAVAALNVLVGKYGIGASSGLLKITPDDSVRKMLKERFGGKP